MFGLTVFLTGFVLMVLELVGSRIVAPYVGNSLPVWTSLIGIILASLSGGYYLGGILADRKPSINVLIIILFLVSIFIALIPIIQVVIPGIVSLVSYVEVAAVVITIILFALPSILIGMVSPFAIRLKLNKLKSSGQTAGGLYALSTLGSIVGTFVAGFFLIGMFSSTIIIYFLALIIFVLCLVLIINFKLIKNFGRYQVIFLLTFFLIIYIGNNIDRNSNLITEFDTRYNRVRIFDVSSAENITTRYLQLNSEMHSAKYLEKEELVFEYTKHYRLMDHFHDNPKKVLMIGGGALTYPMDYLKNHSGGEIDVVEIDGDLTEVAIKYFGYEQNPRLKIYSEDGRTYLNRNKKKYDVILNDAFASYYSIPFQLTTKEALVKMHESLTKDGIVITNMISATHGEKAKFFEAESATYKSVFPYVFYIPVNRLSSGQVQNIMIVATKQKPKSLVSKNEELNKYLKNLKVFSGSWSQILTDNYAPVDQYVMKF